MGKDRSFEQRDFASYRHGKRCQILLKILYNGCYLLPGGINFPYNQIQNTNMCILYCDWLFKKITFLINWIYVFSVYCFFLLFFRWFYYYSNASLSLMLLLLLLVLFVRCINPHKSCLNGRQHEDEGNTLPSSICCALFIRDFKKMHIHVLQQCNSL